MSYESKSSVPQTQWQTTVSPGPQMYKTQKKKILLVWPLISLEKTHIYAKKESQ